MMKSKSSKEPKYNHPLENSAIEYDEEDQFFNDGHPAATND